MAKRMLDKGHETDSTTATCARSAASSARTGHSKERVKATSKGKESKGKESGKSKKAKKEKVKEESSSEEESSAESEADAETVCNNLALQLGLSAKQLKLKTGKVVKVEDLSGEQLTFILAETNKKLDNLSVFTLYELGGELVGLRKGCSDRLRAEAKKKPKKKSEAKEEEEQKDLCGLELSRKKWQFRLCDVYELLGAHSCFVNSRSFVVHCHRCGLHCVGCRSSR